jgi:isoamylase
LLLSEGIPMLTAGDECGRTQGGNNNAYCQDNEVSWLNWGAADQGFLKFIQKLTHLRKRFPVFRRSQFFDEHAAENPATKDIIWLLPGGNELAPSDWNAQHTGCLGIRYVDRAPGERARILLLLVNVSQSSVSFALPSTSSWRCILDTVRSEPLKYTSERGMFVVEGQSLALLVDENHN